MPPVDGGVAVYGHTGGAVFIDSQIFSTFQQNSVFWHGVSRPAPSGFICQVQANKFIGNRYASDGRLLSDLWRDASDPKRRILSGSEPEPSTSGSDAGGLQLTVDGEAELESVVRVVRIPGDVSTLSHRLRRCAWRLAGGAELLPKIRDHLESSQSEILTSGRALCEG